MRTIKSMISEYDAHKVRCSPEAQEAHIEGVVKRLPSWFKMEMGFQFMYESDPAMLVGCGGFRGVDDALRLEMQPSGVLFVYRYKGEWHLADLLTFSQESIGTFSPMPAE